MESETAYLQQEEDYYDADDNVWRCAPGELKIKTKTWGPTGTTGWKLHSKCATLQELAAAWELIKSGTLPVVEVLPAVELLPGDIGIFSPEMVICQYKRAIGGTLEIIRFGAMLIEIDNCLTRAGGKSRNHPSGDGDSLKGWMDEHCPTINYKTAIRYKTLAMGLQSEFKIPAKLPLMLALPMSDGSVDVCIPEGCKVSAERVKEIQEAVWEMIEGKSARQLMFDFGLAEPKRTGGAREGAGRPAAFSDSELAAGAAWGRIGPAIDRATAWKFERFLPESMCREALSTVELLQDALKARLIELSGKGR